MTSGGDSDRLDGWTILLAEDEYLVALDLVRILQAAGARVVGPAPKVSRALALLEAEAVIDVAVLDVNLAGETSFPVAEALVRRAVPIVFATGYDISAIMPEFAGMPRCEKPIEAHRLLAAVRAARAARR